MEHDLDVIRNADYIIDMGLVAVKKAAGLFQPDTPSEDCKKNPRKYNRKIIYCLAKALPIIRLHSAYANTRSFKLIKRKII